MILLHYHFKVYRYVFCICCEEIRLLDIWFHTWPNFSKDLKYSSLKLFKWESELSFRIILSTTQCLGIIYKFSLKPAICLYYCKELLYCLIFCLAYIPSDTLSKSWVRWGKSFLFTWNTFNYNVASHEKMYCSTNSSPDCCKSELFALLIPFVLHCLWLQDDN